MACCSSDSSISSISSGSTSTRSPLLLLTRRFVSLSPFYLYLFLSLSFSLFDRGLLLANATPFPPCPYPPDSRPRWRVLIWIRRADRLEKLTPRILTYLPIYLARYLHASISNVPSPTHVHQTRNPLPDPFRAGKCISAQRTADRNARAFGPFGKWPRVQRTNYITIDNERDFKDWIFREADIVSVRYGWICNSSEWRCIFERRK